jgi:uncharacterized membrane protein YkoI
MIRFISAAFGVVVVGLIAVPPTNSLAYTGQKLEKGAKVSIDDARAIALKARPGAISDEELEREKGGTGLRYSFDIKSGGAVYEVGVDAQTGKVLENKKEGAHPD